MLQCIKHLEWTYHDVALIQLDCDQHLNSDVVLRKTMQCWRCDCIDTIVVLEPESDLDTFPECAMILHWYWDKCCYINNYDYFRGGILSRMLPKAWRENNYGPQYLLPLFLQKTTDIAVPSFDHGIN